MGDLLRDSILNYGTAEDKWSMVADIVQRGEMAPEVSINLTAIIHSVMVEHDSKISRFAMD